MNFLSFDINGHPSQAIYDVVNYQGNGLEKVAGDNNDSFSGGLDSVNNCRSAQIFSNIFFLHTQVGNWSTFGGLQMDQQQNIIWPSNNPDVPREITNTLKNKTIRVVTFVVSYSESMTEVVSQSDCLSVPLSVSQLVRQTVGQSVSQSVIR